MLVSLSCLPRRPVLPACCPVLPACRPVLPDLPAIVCTGVMLLSTHVLLNLPLSQSPLCGVPCLSHGSASSIPLYYSIPVVQTSLKCFCYWMW
jgi:hypothetical protein